MVVKVSGPVNEPEKVENIELLLCWSGMEAPELAESTVTDCIVLTPATLTLPELLADLPVKLALAELALAELADMDDKALKIDLVSVKDPVVTVSTVPATD